MSIEEISMIMDYPLKEGRQRVLEVMEARRAAEAAESGRAKELEGVDIDRKQDVSHVEESRR